MENIGKKIKKIREFKEIKREYLANKLGLGISAYGNIERGVVSINDDRLAQIADLLGVSVDFIKNFEENPVFQNITNTKGVVGNNSNNTINDNNEILIEIKKGLISINQALIKLIEKLN